MVLCNGNISSDDLAYVVVGLISIVAASAANISAIEVRDVTMNIFWIALSVCSLIMLVLLLLPGVSTYMTMGLLSLVMISYMTIIVISTDGVLSDEYIMTRSHKMLMLATDSIFWLSVFLLVASTMRGNKYGMLVTLAMSIAATITVNHIDTELPQVLRSDRGVFNFISWVFTYLILALNC